LIITTLESDLQPRRTGNIALGHDHEHLGDVNAVAVSAGKETTLSPGEGRQAAHYLSLCPLQR
jgi:hypothetical protein